MGRSKTEYMYLSRSAVNLSSMNVFVIRIKNRVTYFTYVSCNPFYLEVPVLKGRLSVMQERPDPLGCCCKQALLYSWRQLTYPFTYGDLESTFTCRSVSCSNDGTGWRPGNVNCSRFNATSCPCCYDNYYLAELLFRKRLRYWIW